MYEEPWFKGANMYNALQTVFSCKNTNQQLLRGGVIVDGNFSMSVLIISEYFFLNSVPRKLTNIYYTFNGWLS